MLDLGVLDRAALADRRVRADVAVGQPRAGADDRRPADRAALEPGARLDDDPAVDLRVDQLAVDPPLDRVEHEPVGGEHVLELAGVLPPALDDVRLDAAARVDQVLDRVGDLELAAAPRARSRGPRRGRAAVNMYTPTSARSVLGSRGFSTSRTTVPSSQLGDPVVLGIGDRREQDQRVGLVGAERRDEVLDPALQQVVAEVHDERRVAEERLGGQHRVGEAERRVLRGCR